MRISRSLQLHDETASIHMYWRCHNKEYYLAPSRNKAMYMQTALDCLRKNDFNQKIHISAYCIMNNHFHSLIEYQNGSSTLSNFMRYSHGNFGARYNRANNRSGKVAESRPKTALIQDSEHEMRVHFYIVANPIRANICSIENLHLYKYSSYKFFAHGVTDEYSEILTIPKWYVDLGRTTYERQKRYRKLFREYIEQSSKKNFLCKAESFLQYFIGEKSWVERNQIRINYKKSNSS